MRILLLSPYDAMSHQYWWQGLRDNLIGHEFCVVTLTPRFFSWRFRGNSLSFAFDERVRESYDLVIATSMTDLSSLRGMCPSLCAIPTIIYFHENQFAYPDNASLADNRSASQERLVERQVERQITSIYTAISADLLLFNSCFNRDTFLKGAAELLAKLPDGVPAGLVDRLRLKTAVQSVPLWQDTFAMSVTGDAGLAKKTEIRPLNIVWNHRWEYDKGLGSLASLVDTLVSTTREKRVVLHIIGQSFRQVPKELQQIKAMLENHGSLGRFGFLESRQDYLELLRDSHVVLSTAIHEFQGIAVLEAMACGCIPLVPNALAYKEFVPEEYRYDTNSMAVPMLLALTEAYEAGTMPAQPNLARFSWDHQIIAWQGHLNLAMDNFSQEQ
ncbi:MAG: glycosyltransferase involved in cell wall biosynthesis [Candidatus Azotimanducaceae bacterium]|jgi:glycosyltransferase involved in cell wall biosynthesis